MTEPATGLRERKKRETRAALTRAAHELFIDRGYEETTLGEDNVRRVYPLGNAVLLSEGRAGQIPPIVRVSSTT